MAKTNTAHNKARSPRRSAQYPVRRNGVIFIVVKSYDNKEA
jgi:hypothetical protein